MIDRRRDRALYQQLADELRRQIRSGDLPPGADLPSEKALEQSTGIGRDAVRQAIAVLRNEGLVTTQRGRQSQVREPDTVIAKPVQAPAVVRARMPTPEEGKRFDLPDGVPVLTVRTNSGQAVYPADRVELQVRSESA